MKTGAISFLEMRTEAVLGSIRVLNDLLEVALRALGVPGDQRHDLALGLAELVANVCQHEYAAVGDSSPGVTVALDARDGDLLLTVTSFGPPFDLKAQIQIATARDPLEELAGSGLGLPLLVALFDELESTYEQGPGNVITLRKRRAS